MHHSAHNYSTLLPDLFRHKITKVRVPQPRAILLDFHGTISERRWEDKVIFPYVKQAVGGYLKDNWDQDVVQKCVPGLRNESFEQRFRNKFDDAPVINEPVDGEDDLVEARELAKQMSDFIVWQMDSKKETRETQIIERLVWQDGFRQKRILTPIFEDVLPCVRDWSTKHKCAIYIISSLEHETLKILFENTSKGNLDQYVRDYVSTKSGDKLVSDVYKKYYESLHLDSSADKLPQSPRDDLSPTHQNLEAKQSLRTLAKSPNGNSTSSPPSIRSPEYMVDNSSSPASPASGKASSRGGGGGCSSSSSSPFEHLAKPILFLTDSGQEAKAASQVNDGRAFECILVNRPGNKKIRTYYLSQFAYVDRFDDIEFVK